MMAFEHVAHIYTMHNVKDSHFPPSGRGFSAETTSVRAFGYQFAPVVKVQVKDVALPARSTVRILAE